MDSTIKQFQTQHTNAQRLLDKLQDFLAQGSALGVNIDPSLPRKLAEASQELGTGKLKVALIGGFSEGKTSIAAAWLGRLDKSTMRISQQESSNEVTVYSVGDDCELIDTPGLFGFKEQYNADLKTVEKYKDITRKYVSQAHLVLYVMNSTNPVKESHKEDLIWLLRTLQLLSRTVFVLSRFDEVADVEDERSYQEHLRVKRDNVQARLRDAIGPSEKELAQLSIVAVAANPFDMGMEYWLENSEKFKALSHIGLLQQATATRIEQSGGPTAVVEQARKSVILEVLHKEMPVAVENDRRLGDEVERLQDVHRTFEHQLNAVRQQASEARVDLREFVVGYFSGLIMRTQGLIMETAGDFYQTEIGKDGIIVTTRLQNEFERQLQGVTHELGRMRLSFDSEINHFNSVVIELGSQGVNYVVKGNFINNASILAARDGVVNVAKTLGVDIGKALSFKPWGAVNLAKNLNGLLLVVGVALEAWDSYERMKREKEFEASKRQMLKYFEAQREEVLALIDKDGFVERFFPEYAELLRDAESVQETLARQEDLRRRFRQWRTNGEVIEAEFVEHVA